MQLTFEGLRVKLPDGVAMEFCGGALRLHATNLTGTISICRADACAGPEPASADPLASQLDDLPCSQPRAPPMEGRKRSPDSGLQTRTTKAIRTSVQPRLADPLLLLGKGEGERERNGPLSPRSDDWAEAEAGVGNLAPPPRAGQPRALDAAWSDMVSGQAPPEPAEPGLALSRPLCCEAAAPDPAADSALGASAPATWRWTRLELGAGPAGRWGHTAELVLGGGEGDASLYVCGGEGVPAGGAGAPEPDGHVPLADLWRLDLAAGAWERKRDAPCARTWHSCCHGILAPSDKGATLLLAGGESAQPPAGARQLCADLAAYDVAHDSWFAPWSSGAPPSRRSGHSAVLAEGCGRMVLFGGAGRRKAAEPDVWQLDTRAWKWGKLPVSGKPPFARTFHSATRLSGGRMLVFAGNDDERSFGKGRVHVLDLASREWTHPEVRGELPAARTGHVAVCFGGRHVLVHGGWDYDADGGRREFRDDAAVLDTETWEWTRVSCEALGQGEAGAPAPRTGHAAVACGRAAMRALGGGARGEASLSDEAGALPALLLHGGMSLDGRLLGDSWLLEPVMPAAPDSAQPAAHA